MITTNITNEKLWEQLVETSLEIYIYIYILLFFYLETLIIKVLNANYFQQSDLI